MLRHMLIITLYMLILVVSSDIKAILDYFGDSLFFFFF